MNVIAINLTDSDQTQYLDQVSSILQTNIINLNYNNIDDSINSNSLYTKLCLAALSLENYIIDNTSYNNPNKSYINCLLYWQPDTNNLDKIVIYKDMFIKNWCVIQNQNDPNWIFGNIPTLCKWAGSLHKINTNDFYTREPGLDNCISHALVYAGRIGLNVQGLV